MHPYLLYYRGNNSGGVCVCYRGNNIGVLSVRVYYDSVGVGIL